MNRVSASNILIKERKRLLFFALPFTFTTYTLTDKVLITKTGFLNTEEDEIRLHRILDLTVKRSFWQRIMGLGNIEVNSSDKTTPFLVIKNIKHTGTYRALLSEVVEKERFRTSTKTAEVIDAPRDDGYDFDGDGMPDLDIH
ncbi:MAG: PH domain-containing protein [Oscillospiraceae bacterium]|jgi:uncharacterized membrane protein YdbT with pleckstrin-like domain|nr:PH domain-containing protein [Oscillospiraceae bacterium]